MLVVFSMQLAKGCAYALLAVLAARLLLRWMRLPSDDLNTFTASWVTITLAGFFAGHFVVMAIMIAVIVAITRKKSRSRGVIIFLALLPALPSDMFDVPGAFGINRLTTVSYAGLLTLVLLLPEYFQARRQPKPQGALFRNGADAFMLLFFVWGIVLALVHRPSSTDKIRVAFEIVVFSIIPYIALSRGIQTQEDFRKVLLALVFSGTVLAFIGLAEAVTNWHMYENYAQNHYMRARQDFVQAYEWRFHVLRIRGSVGQAFGLILIISLAALICLARMRQITRFKALVCAGALCLAILCTGTRGMWLATLVMLGVTWAFRFLKTPLRFALTLIIIALLFPTVQSLVMSAADPFGTFDYRAELLKSAIPLVLDRPWLGWPSDVALFATGKLDHLLQGQGIIDLVNTYLSQALFGGLPAFILYAGSLAASVWAVLRRRARGDSVEALSASPLAAALAGCVLALASLVITISSVDYIGDYTVILIALCSAYAALPSLETSPETEAVMSNVPQRPRRTRRFRRPTAGYA